MINTSIVVLVAILLFAVSAEAAPKPAAKHLLTEYLENPLGIDVTQPRFSWQFEQVTRGATQSAYQIQVADNPFGEPNVWDSGKVMSAETVNIPLPDKHLASGMRYYWRVKAWDGEGVESEWSEPAWFEMGLLDKADWKATWLVSPESGNGYHSQFSDKEDSIKWVQIDLGEPMEIGAVRLHPAKPYNWKEEVPGFGFPIRYRVEASDDPSFAKSVVLVDRTDEDQPNPKEDPATLSFAETKVRYVRLTATKLFSRQDGQKCLALAEMEVLNKLYQSLSLGKAVTASDSTEELGWNAAKLTDGSLKSVEVSKSAPAFRHEFEVGKQVKRARAYVAGLGYCELRLNGRKVGDKVLDPAYTAFGKRVLYSTYDVTDMLEQGRNAVGAILGKGWWGKSPRFILQLNVDYADGTHADIVSGPGWKRGESPILENSLYHGETYDARKEQPGWDEPGFDDSRWDAADSAQSPTETLSAEMIQPIRVCESMKPKKIANPKPGVWVYDFGQNFSGWCRLTVSGPAGTEISLKHAEVLYKDGTVNQENLRSAQATDRYILKGDGTETYEPRFTYHGFRYVQVEGFPGKPSLKTLEGRVVHTDFAPRGSFECSNPLINQIWKNAWWGFKTNFHSIPTDCPQRDERQGWMGDAQVAAELGLFDFDMAPAYTKFLQDMHDAQGEDGAVPDTVPHVWGSQPGDPMWAIAYPSIAWDVYRHTGDKRLLEQHYDGLKHYVDMLAREAKGYIISRNNYGDWVGVVDTPKDLISTGAFYRSAWIVAQAAEVLGKSKDAREYESLCRKIADAFNRKFLHPETNTYGNNSQYSNVWPLYLGIVPKGSEAGVLGSIVSDVAGRKGHLSTGFLGTRYLFDVLCDSGQSDVAYTIVTRKDYPGWGYMIANDATTVWELWKLETGKGMNSHNHPAYGAIGGWFYRMIAGIVPDADNPGFEHFDIKPFMMGGLKEAKASVETIRGRVSSHWVKDDKGITLKVEVPANTRASVYVPRVGKSTLTEGSKLVFDWKFHPGVNGIDGASRAGEWIKVEVGSGKYEFRF